MIPTEAKLIGYAPDIDLALLKINVPNLPYLPLGGPLERGQLVLAIGHPFDRHTVTLGIVSHVGHHYKGMPFDLADAEINSGNSGGPLVNMRGALVGIYVARFFTEVESRHDGLGGMISVTDIKLLLPRLLKEGLVTFGYTGLKLRGYDPNWDERYETLSYDHRDELLVTGVEENSPAASAGLMPGDKITAVDGNKFLTQREFVREVLYRKPGEMIVIDIVRDGKSVHYKLRLGARAPEPAL
jgi:S1-C subfamily serine protease